MGLAELKIGPVRYNSPITQVVLIGLVCFATVGMFSAINNLGAGGTENQQLSDVTNAVLYSLFAVMGLFAGGVCNVLGPRLTLFIGSLGYSLYVGGLWCYQTTGNQGFLIASGALLGISAALLWAAQGSVMMSYPLEGDKGKAFGIFWAIFQLGSLVGSAITLGIEAKSTLGAVSTSTYIAIIVIMFVGSAATWLILPADKIVRSDGTLVKLEKQSSVKSEIHGFVQTCKDWRMLLLIPMFFYE